MNIIKTIDQRTKQAIKDRNEKQSLIDQLGQKKNQILKDYLFDNDVLSSITWCVSAELFNGVVFTSQLPLPDEHYDMLESQQISCHTQIGGVIDISFDSTPYCNVILTFDENADVLPFIEKHNIKIVGFFSGDDLNSFREAIKMLEDLEKKLS